MKKIILDITLSIVATIFATVINVSFAIEDVVKANRKLEPFELNQVSLLPSPFLDAQRKNVEYLLSVDPDRLLARIRETSGLRKKAESYGGWEGMSISGHSLGHYLSAVSKSYAATGDPRFKEIANYIVKELAECQSSSGDGALAGDERFRSAFKEIARGDVRSQGFDLNGLWVPWYVEHKIFAGLLDAHRYCDDALALEVAKKLGDWGIETTRDLDFEQFQTMLRCEYGGMNEAYYNLFAATGDEKYLRQGDRFYDLAVLKPLSECRDELRGRHANTQIPKLIGLARRAELVDDGETKASSTARFFWERVVRHHSYALGGNSSGEHFGASDAISSRLSDSTCETCNTYNMLKLTQKLYLQTGDIECCDFFERALYNHILSSIDREVDRPDSLYTYFVPTTPGGFRTYSTRENTWTCCHGTGMENHVQYNGEIYYRERLDDGSDVLDVALAIPSKLDWKEKGIVATLTPDGRFIVDAKDDVALTIKVRVPRNCRAESGEVEGRWLVLGNKWSKGVHETTLNFVAEWKLEPTPDNPDVEAFFCGPVLYVGDLGDKNVPIVGFDDDERSVGVVAPIVATDSHTIEATLANDDWRKSHSFFDLPETATVAASVPSPTIIKPFFNAQERALVYFNFFTNDEWNAKRAEFEKERERRRRLQENTICFFQPGEMQPERDANLTSEKSYVGEHMGRKWRDARDGGWFEFDMKVEPSRECLLVLTYWGDETGNRDFAVLIDGVQICERKLNRDKPSRFFDEAVAVPNSEGKTTVRVRLQAKPGAMAGGLFGARTIPKDFAEEMQLER